MNKFSRPDYAGGSIANLMVSLDQALGHSGSTEDRVTCTALSEKQLREARHVVLLVVDGMGALQLATHAPDGALAGNKRTDLTSVFPSTTASAVSTYLTGDAPLTHGLTGWHMWFRELDEIAAPLPFKTRGSHVPLRSIGVDAADLLRTRAFTGRLTRRCDMLHPSNLCGTDYTEAHRGNATVRAFETLTEMATIISRLSREREPSYCYAYWPVLDSLSHKYGWASEEAANQLRGVDRVVGSIAHAVSGTGTVLLVCADHGFVDTRADTRLRLEDYPDIAGMLEQPLCGEPRLVYCYVKNGAGAEFEAAVVEQLGYALDVCPSERLIEEGFLGSGISHPEIQHRIGTHALFLRDEYCLTDRLPGEDPFSLIGVHGGMSDGELRVPLCVFD